MTSLRHKQHQIKDKKYSMCETIMHTGCHRVLLAKTNSSQQKLSRVTPACKKPRKKGIIL